MKRSSLFCFVLLGSMIFLSMPDVSGQYMPYEAGRFNAPQKESLFHVLPSTMPTVYADSVRLTVFSRIAFDFLQFVFKDTIYESNYELTYQIRDVKGGLAESLITRSKVTTRDYQETNARHIFSQKAVHFMLKPGLYELLIELRDMETEDPVRHKVEIKIPAYHGNSLAVSDLLYYRSRSAVELEVDMDNPIFPGIRNQRDSTLYAHFYLYHPAVGDSFTIHYTYTPENEEPRYTHLLRASADQFIQSVFIKLDEPMDFGQYDFHVKISRGDDSVSVQSPLYIRWGSHSTGIQNLKQAIGPLEYIMNPSLYRQLRGAAPEEQKEIIHRFWKDRDPTPETEQNELEDEFYQRVIYASRNFSEWHQRDEGWKTDRGRIYIVYGTPTEIEHSSFSSRERRRYEIWNYKHLQRRFVFAETSITGEYRLISEE